MRCPLAPVHAARDRQALERCLDDPGQERNGRLARLHAHEEEEGALALIQALSASTGVPQLSAKASAARVGAPAASNDALTGGPLRFMFCSGWWLARRFTHTASLRGVA